MAVNSKPLGNCNNLRGKNQFQEGRIRELKALMNLLKDGPVGIYDVTLTQCVDRETARSLLGSLEKAGIAESYYAKATRIRRNESVEVRTKLWRLARAYHLGLAVFEPSRMVRA